MAIFVKLSCQVLSRFSGVYLCQVCSSVLYENMQVCNMWAKVTISVSVPQVSVHSRCLNVLLRASVTGRLIINKFHVFNNDPTNIHVLEFGPSYDVRME